MINDGRPSATLPDREHATGNASNQARPFRTLSLFVVLALLTLELAYFNSEAVMTRDAFRVLLGDRLDVSRIDAQYALVRRWNIVGYVLSPIFLAVQLGVASLLCQLGLLLIDREVRLSALFRLGILAHGPLLLASAIRSLWLSRLPTEALTAATFRLVPGSVASVVLDPSEAQSSLYVFLSAMNAGELAWCAVTAHGLMKLARLSLGEAVAFTAALWLVMELSLSSLQVLVANGG